MELLRSSCKYCPVHVIEPLIQTSTRNQKEKIIEQGHITKGQDIVICPVTASWPMYSGRGKQRQENTFQTVDTQKRGNMKPITPCPKYTTYGRAVLVPYTSLRLISPMHSFVVV